MGLPREARLGGRRQIREVCRRGRRVALGWALLWWLPNSGGGARLAVQVPRRVGGAVVRNRLRRRLQEQFRAGWAGLRPVDLVLRLSPAEPAAAELGTVWDLLCQRAGLWREARCGR
ncbi:MAG: ribonuclease P protein component [Fimbriimonadaceae bacterium]|nr:ribonuclease P protein component [Fimbriimonadaceae bacterium]